MRVSVNKENLVRALFSDKELENISEAALKIVEQFKSNAQVEHLKELHMDEIAKYNSAIQSVCSLIASQLADLLYDE